MGTIGSSLWGGGGGEQQQLQTSIPVKNLFYMALRLAHVTQRAQIGPSPDQFADCLQQAQLMISQANIRGAMIFSIAIDAYPLVANAKIYTLGPGGSGALWLGPTRPVKIEHANLILSTGTTVRLGIFLGSPAEWSQVAVQDISGFPQLLYCDYNYPLSNVYVVPQDDGTNQLELHTWQAIPSPVTVDDLIAYPPGYDDWFVNNLAVRLASVFAAEGAYVTDDTRQEARRSTSAIQSKNTGSPRMTSDAPGSSRGRRGFNYLSGMDR